MVAILCDICRTELEPRDRRNYGWFSQGGLVVLVDGRPARLQHNGKDVNEVCYGCAPKCVARVWVSGVR